MDDLNRRNIIALAASLKELTRLVFLLQERVDGLVATIGTLAGRMIELECMVTQYKALIGGSGPTVR